MRILTVVLLGLPTSLFGCEGEFVSGPAALDYVRVPSASENSRASVRQALGADGQPLYLYLNFCREDCTFTPGANDARQRTSSIPQFPVTLPESVVTDEEYDELLRCLYEIFEPFDVLITNERPVENVYVEAVVSGKPTDLGLSPTIAGVSPLACELIEYGINFNFFQVISRLDGMGELCNVIAHETGHTIGLEHAYLCSDAMTYLPHCENPAFFTRADADCGGFFRETCTCGAEYQNSYHTVLEEIGPRRHPIDLPPKLRIISPEFVPGFVLPVQQGYFVVADATDDDGIDQVELFLDGVSQSVLRAPPYAFATPLDWRLGPVTARVIATDFVGRTATVTRELDVRARMPEWDAGFLDAAGPRPDAGMIWLNADAAVAPDHLDPNSLPEEGCSCRASSLAPGRFESDVLLWLSLLLLPLGLRRRRGTLAVLLFGALLGGCESDAFVGFNPELATEPPLGAVIDFGEYVLGDRLPRPIDVQLHNRGDGPLLLGETALDETPYGDLELIGPLRSHLDPEASTELTVALRPWRPGRVESELRIASNDPDLPLVTFPVRAKVRERCRLVPWPTALDFELRGERSFSVLNPTASPCEIISLAVDEALFEILDPPALPFALGPNEELELTVRHHTRSQEPHVPIRTLRVRERESDGADVRLIGAYPIWNCLEAFPLEYEFPETPAGATTDLFMSVTNRCRNAAEVSALGMTYGSEVFSWDETTFPAVVPARGFMPLKISFRPLDGLDYYERMRVSTTDAAHRAIYVGMVGRALGPFFMAPPKLDLGAVPFPSPSGSLCQTPDRHLPVFNLGAGALLVRELSLRGPDASAFAIEGVELNGVRLTDWRAGFEVPAYGYAEVLLRFGPTRGSPSDHAAELLVTHAPRATVHAITLSARALGEVESTERFLVEAPQLDTLFVVDGSRSMRTRKERLSAAIEGFVARTDMETESSQIALIPTREERPEAGRLLGCRFRDPVLRSSEGSIAERVDNFRCALGLNQDDERPTAGLAGAAIGFARGAFPSPRDPTTRDNQVFMRDEAHLGLVFISDEDDLSRPAVEFFHAMFRGMKGGRSDRLRVHSIVVPRGGRCLGERYSIPGERYARAAELSGGRVEDVCALDLGPALDTIGDELFAPSRGFELSHWADPSSVSVSVNGLPAVLDPELGYDVDRRTNAIVFAGVAAPRLDDIVEVRYRSVCAP